MKKYFFIIFLMLSIYLTASSNTEKLFIGKWHVIEKGYESEMTFSNGFMTWSQETYGTSVYKYSVTKEGDSKLLNLKLDNSFEIKLIIENVTKNEIYLSRPNGSIIKLSRLY